MLIDDVPISKRFITLYKSAGIKELYPPQQQLVESGALQARGNVVLSTPTASGKTFASELLIAKALEAGKKAVYVVPLRALAHEKYTEFRRYEELGYHVRLEMGDLDSSKYWRKPDFDILVTTAEKCDSILRTKPDWFNGVGVLVMDEVHLIASDRGPVYEILISKFQMLYGDVQVLALSATIGNSDELATWLNAKLIQSTWRPVELKEEVEVGKDKYVKIKELVLRSVSGGGQVLVFVNSRRSAEAVAERLGADLHLADDREKIMKLEEEIVSTLSTPTSQCRRLSGCVRGGTAFHHAGITNRQRVLVEDAFKGGLLKAIVATPTLAAGVNLPSRMVIVRDVQRYDEDGAGYIPVLEYKQQVGRAGRPKYDTYGEAVLIAKTEHEKEFFIEKYVGGEVEPIYSQLGVESVLRFHILAAVASGFSRTEKALMEFFRSTFFGHQYGLEGFELRIKNIVKKLSTWEFLKEENNFLLPTALGRRVSELYIDPQTAYNYLQILSKAEAENKFPAVGLLELLCDAAEMPHLRIRRQEEAKLWEDACRSADELFRDLSGFDLDATFLERFRTAKLFEQWISEETEEHILETYNVAPGTLHQRLQIAKWLAYSASELSDLTGLKKSAKEMKRLEVRIESGVKEELLALVGIKGIGRVRARKLFSSGIRTVADLKKTETKKLAALIGEKTAENIKEEIKKEEEK